MQRSFTDQLNREILINYPPKRIVSLVPSQTELLFELGLDQEIIGLTKFCIHPIEKFAERTKIGGTKKLNIQLIRDLNPDLIIGNKEENEQSQIEELMEDYPVWMSDIYTLEDAKKSIAQIGELVDRQPEASYLNHLISAGFNDLQTLAVQNGINKKVAYLIWKKPYMLAGRDTFIDNILALNGLSNVIKEKRYPEIKLNELAKLKPDLIFLSSEPYPFKEAHLEEIRAVVPEAKVMLVDGEMFSWYGSRLVKAVQYLFQLQKQLY
ncbi:ABC transporter substrate-binding protein [Pedobacter panaciterrae]|jgi:ABC-type Fe3+-hydroxamate transport system, periplasmic component|uniref:ABC transporter substrate-binding protein n=1 Tax=Pedobacter panaciterrae TaxID=363849 RepID=UPI00155DD6EB|nr:helical backbone metal receptor [Pedobacter panaciterrae]NQX53690.1 ABC transporter substrate-binding protein [Pedobacter panaciterrae]